MKNKFLVSTFIAVSMISFAAQAGDNYIGLGASVSKLNDVDVTHDTFGKVGTVPYKTGYGINAQLGTKLTPNVRAELEYSFRQHEIDGLNTEHDSHAAMANLYYDIDTGSAISPYLGAGIGYGGVDDTADFYDGFAYQGMTGLNYRFSQDLVGYVGYKYFSIVNPKKGDLEVEYDTHNAEMGLRFEFGGNSQPSNYSAAPASSYNTSSLDQPVAAPQVEVAAMSPNNYTATLASPQSPPRYVAMDAGATPPVLQATPASQAAVSSTSAPVTNYAAPASIPGVKESVYLPQYRSDLQPVAPQAQNGWVLTEDPYLADYRAKRGY